MAKTLILSVIFCIACNVANAMDHTPRGIVTVGAPTVLVGK